MELLHRRTAQSKFDVVTMALVIECGGNGRAFFDPPAKGNQWTYRRGGLFQLDRGAAEGCARAKAGVKSGCGLYRP